MTRRESFVTAMRDTFTRPKNSGQHRQLECSLRKHLVKFSTISCQVHDTNAAIVVQQTIIYHHELTVFIQCYLSGSQAENLETWTVENLQFCRRDWGKGCNLLQAPQDWGVRYLAYFCTQNPKSKFSMRSFNSGTEEWMSCQIFFLGGEGGIVMLNLKSAVTDFTGGGGVFKFLEQFGLQIWHVHFPSLANSIQKFQRHLVNKAAKTIWFAILKIWDHIVLAALFTKCLAVLELACLAKPWHKRNATYYVKPS